MTPPAPKRSKRQMLDRTDFPDVLSDDEADMLEWLGVDADEEPLDDGEVMEFGSWPDPEYN